MTSISDRLELYRAHPAAQAEEMFDIDLDPWQREVVESFPHSPRIAMQACTGPGKTLVLGLLGWNFLLTRRHCAINAASISAANLATGLWTQLARLYESNTFLKKKFQLTNSRIFARDHPNTWFLESKSWAKDANVEQIGTALKGLHAPYVMWLLDETGAFPPAILSNLEAIFSGSPEEAHIVMAGNPVSRQGLLFRCAVTNKRYWKVVPITADPDDPLRTPRVSIEHARQQIATAPMGRDDPWVRMNILGQFPLSDVNALIGEEEVRAAQNRYYREFEIGDAPKVMGVDVAREGDDYSVIFRRQGLQSWPVIKKRIIASDQGASLVSREWEDFQADACFIDMSGGYGGGWYDHLKLLGRSPLGVQFAGQAHNPERYYNKRAEMYFDAVQWIRRGGALPQSDEIPSVLSQITYSFAGDRLLLEPKEDVKKRLGYSPDETDAMVLSHAEPVAKAVRNAGRAARTAAGVYRPFEEMDRRY